MAPRSSVVLRCLAAPLALAACGPAETAHSMPRAETAFVAAHRAPPPVAAATPQTAQLALAPEPAAPPPSAASPAKVADEVSKAAFESAERPLVRKLERAPGTWQGYLRGVRELSRYAARFAPFDLKAADGALTRAARSPASVTAWTIADGPFAWSPARGVEYWVTAGSIGDGALIAVLELLPSGELRHAASLVIDDKDTSVALGTSADHPNEVLWTTCYGCPGEGGSITLGDDGRPGFVYR